ncbi:MAG: ATP-dependent 6-phosphofructokinase [Anaerolineales bacterium]|nr:ATP-dependent 6-phosphofructokinase [Anaerolineales bacterium]MCB0011356.1 ATP-dependent 6-phosphofructokinase [Anaerolineales bacterium]MCB8958951.1 ATP-dependent 6-phosphofructokinase [Ardenticatenales bacterium]
MSKRIAISTGGGDAPGLNAVIRAATLAALNRGWEVFGIRDGFDGILKPEEYPEGGITPLTRQTVRGITHLGGTIIGTTNRGNPFNFPIQNEAGEWIEIDRSDEIVNALKANGIDYLISIGGDGSLNIAHRLAQKGVKVIGVPKTIDNDLDGTVVTFGFNTACYVATSAIDRLHTTAESHRRVMVVEVMGRYAGWIALYSGVAATADVILIPEIPYDIHKVADKINARTAAGNRFSIVVVAEGAKPVDGQVSIIGKSIGQAVRLGGVGHKVAAEIEALTGKETRTVVLGHVVRGGTPTSYDRLLALRFGAAAVRAIEAGEEDIMVALDPPSVHYVPLEECTRRMKTVPLDYDLVLTARDLGISFGD